MKKVAKWVAFLWSAFCLIGVLYSIFNSLQHLDRLTSDGERVGSAIGYGNIYGVFVDIQTNIQYIIIHDLPPWLWLWAVCFFGSQSNPRLQGSQAFNF